MATLKLKKLAQTVVVETIKHPITEIREYADLNGKFAVTRQHPDTKSMRFTCFHNSMEEAIDRAKLLQPEHPLSKYLVVQIVASVQ